MLPMNRVESRMNLYSCLHLLFKFLQAAFLSALAGSEVAQAAAQAALTTLSEVYKGTRNNYRSLPRNTLQQGGNDK